MSLTMLADQYVRSRYGPTKSGDDASGSFRAELEAIRSNLTSDQVGNLKLTGKSIGQTRDQEGKAPDAGAFLDRLMTYIPTEVIAAYVPLVALATPTGSTAASADNVVGLWVLFFVFLACSPLAVILAAYGKYRQLPQIQAPPRISRRPLRRLLRLLRLRRGVP